MFYDLLAQATGMQILMVVVGIMATLVSALAIFNLKSIMTLIANQAKRIDDIDSRQEKFEKVFVSRKENCQREFVSAEQWVREESRTNTKLDKIADALAELSGSVKIIDKIPQIVGRVTQEIVNGLNKRSGDSNG